MNLRDRKAFTLVELMTALVVISILAGMTMAALSAAAGSARLSKAKGQALAVQELLLTRMEEYITRRMPTPGAGAVAIQGFSLRGPESSRLRLMQLRHAMRFELPDRKSDLYAPGFGPSLPVPTFQRVWYSNNFTTGSPPPPQLETPLTPLAAPPAHSKYINLIHGLVGGTTPAASFAAWSEKYEGSETLYLILATSQVGGRSGLELIPRDQVGDLDGDGVPEVLDAWGTPMVWIRWPVGYMLTYADRSEWIRMNEDQRRSIIDKAIVDAGKDQFDILESDWRNLDGNSANDTFNLTPLVVSAGPDRNFDLMLRSQNILNDGSVDPSWDFGTPILYGTMVWPSTGGNTSVFTYGTIPAVDSPYVGPYYYIDPYAALYHSVDYAVAANPFTYGQAAGLPGAFYDANDDGVDDSADNVYSVRAQ
jgi:prepilin-type N-terminal cleavage/methylation domain-containing protein